MDQKIFPGEFPQQVSDLQVITNEIIVSDVKNVIALTVNKDSLIQDPNSVMGLMSKLEEGTTITKVNYLRKGKYVAIDLFPNSKEEHYLIGIEQEAIHYLIYLDNETALEPKILFQAIDQFVEDFTMLKVANNDYWA